MMIDDLYIHNFKILIDKWFKLSQFNVFIGPNGSGKSSVLQALAVARYVLYDRDAKYIPYPMPRSPVDLRHVLHRDKPFIIKLSGTFYYQHKDLGNLAIKAFIEVNDYSVKERRLLQVSIDSKTILSESDIPKEGSKTIEVEGKTIEVTRTRIRIPVNERSVTTLEPRRLLWNVWFIPTVRGEADIATSPSPEIGLRYHQLLGLLASNHKLKRDVSRVLSEILGYRFELDLRLVSSQQWALENLIYGYEKGKAINFAIEAFGCAQLIYLLVYMLAVNEGSTICIEEPEIHLHPASQARLVEKLVDIARKRKLQLIITTHSEHVLLKFLNLVARKEISKDDVKVYYFVRDPENPVAILEELPITETGELVGGLKGFFEHEVEMLEEFLKARISSR